MDITVGVVVVTRSQSFFETGLSVINDVRGDVFKNVSLDSDIEYTLKQPCTHPVYEEAKNKAVRFLNQRKDRISVQIIQADSLERAYDKIISHNEISADENNVFQMGMLFIDYTDSIHEELTTNDIDNKLVNFYSLLQQASVETFYSATSAAVFILSNKNKIYYQPTEYIECILPDDRSILQAELLCLWMDFFEMSFINRRVKPKILKTPNNTLGEQLVSFLCKRNNTDWLGYYFTGSLVSSFIRYLETEADNLGVMLLRGANEHSLACGALANWQLHNKPFLLIVTSGMIDEFKGTLANLHEARAKGFIICAESRVEQWFAFQGTISVDEDTRDVLKARRIPFVHIEEVDAIDKGIKKAIELYDTNEGPVIIVATQSVLEACSSIEVEFPEIKNNISERKIDYKTQIVLEDVIELINGGPDKLVWQCGLMNEEELSLTISIAERAGIALVDSLTHPGSVSKYYNGKVNRNYLGTLAVYGYNPCVYNYLHTNGKLNPRSEQCLFFLKSKLGQASTPFPEGRLQRKLEIVQLTHNKEHIAPFTDHPLVLNYLSFLQYIDKYLDVSSELKKRRYNAIDRVINTPSDVVSKLPKIPMSPNYFFSNFNKLIERLILEHNFEYTGVYDVGRCGLSAVRNVSQTGPGFSGWYGRALMGDALQSIGSLAFTTKNNIIGFIGDGAKGIVPDVLPSLLENALSYPDQLKKNITIFFFLNGGHSVIQTYQERILFHRTSRQMRLVNILSSDWEEEICGIQVVSRTIETFDITKLTSALLKPRCINLFSVVVSHNNEGDGLSLATAGGWQRDEAFKEYEDIKIENKSKELEHEIQE